jgi:selenium-binding protein 1
VKFIPGNPEGAAIAATVGSAQIWVVYPSRKDSNGNQGVAELIFDFGDKVRETSPIAS